MASHSIPLPPDNPSSPALHTLSSTSILSRFSTNATTGLTTAQAHSLLLKHGPNLLTAPTSPSFIRLLLHNLSDFFSLLLLLAAFLSFFIFLLRPTQDSLHLYLALFLLLLLLLTALLSTLHTRRSQHLLANLSALLPHSVSLIRDAVQLSLPPSHLVPGDLIRLSPGDRVPADVRILSTLRCAVDNASLTGESTPVFLSTLPSNANHPLHASNLAFMGAHVLQGSAVALVVATSDHTFIGSLATLAHPPSLSSLQSHKTPLQVDIRHFIFNISLFACLVGLFFFFLAMYLHVSFLDNLVYTIGIIVSNIPEGLLATISISLAASATRLARRHVVVKRLDAIEALGSTSVILTDKTGTLTRNSMDVSHVVVAGSVHALSPEWFKQATLQLSDDHFRSFLRAASLSSTAVFDENDRRQHPNKPLADCRVCGDASEAGILRFTHRFHDTIQYRRQNPPLTSVPFHSVNRFMVSVNKCEEGSLLVFMKGAAESVLGRSDRIFARDGMRDIAVEDRELVERQMTYLARKGERVFGLAQRVLSREEAANFDALASAEDIDEDQIPTTGLCFLGLLSLTDPPREGTKDAISQCRKAGIRVMMVTGDHVETALSIGQQVGIVTKSKGHVDSVDAEDDVALVIDGADLQKLSDNDWQAVLSHQEVVVARAAPQHKVEIVERLQATGAVVTATGDGCNDAPALKVADTGIAMGGGSDVSREAADMVLLNDEFKSVPMGVAEGRLILDNLKKSIAYTLTSNVPQLLPFVAVMLLRVPLPLTSVLILCVDLGTDIFPAIALAYEGAENDIMQRKPRGRKDRLVNRRLVSFAMLQLGMMQTLAGFLGYFVVIGDYGLSMRALVGADVRGRFGTGGVRGRWMFAEQTRVGSAGYRVGWFERGGKFDKYFVEEVDGFERQRAEIVGEFVEDGQLENMVKAIAVETGRPPCVSFSCVLDGGGERVRDDMACFNVGRNKGPVRISGVSSSSIGRRNELVQPGTRMGQGCFEIWSPSRARKVLRLGQTAFFVAIVVTQVFTLVVCRTRLSSALSGRHKGNWAIMMAIAVELMVAIVLVYVKPLAKVLGTTGIDPRYWLVGLPFGVMMVAYDEARKWLMRRHVRVEQGLALPTGGLVDAVARWVYEWTYW